MRCRPVHFFSDRLRLDGDLYLPENPSDTPLPTVVACSGYQGLKDIHPARIARALVPHGYAVLAFDYRGFGYSEGERGRVAPQDWVEDIRAAVSFVQGQPEVDPDRVGLFGWALGGGVVIAEAADDERVRAVATCQAVGDGGRSIRFMHDRTSWEQLRADIAHDRLERAVSGRSRNVDPFAIVRLDLDTATVGYVGQELTKAAGFAESGVSLESADYYLRFRPEDAVARLAGRPLLLVHGDRNELHAPEESERLYARAHEPKELVVLEGCGHTEFMYDEHPAFGRLAALLRHFYDKALRSAALSVR